MKLLRTAKKCPECSCGIDGILKDNGFINPEFALHYKETHGVPISMLALMLSEKMFIDKEIKNKFVERYEKIENSL